MTEPWLEYQQNTPSQVVRPPWEEYSAPPPPPAPDEPAPQQAAAKPPWEEYGGKPQTPQAPDTSHWAVTRGILNQTFAQDPEAAAASLEGIAHFGPESFKPALTEYAKRLRDYSAKQSKDPSIALQAPKLEDINGIAPALTWAGETFGAGLSSTKAPIAGGLAGFAVGGPYGAAGGAALGGSYLNYGEVYKALKEEAKVDDATAHRWALGALPVMSALDVMGLSVPGAHLLINPVKKEGVRLLARRVLGEAGKGALSEGGTEALQEATKIGAVANVPGSQKPDFFTAETGKAMLEAFAGGAIVGGPLSGLAGLKSDKAPAGTPAAELQRALETKFGVPTDTNVIDEDTVNAVKAASTEHTNLFYHDKGGAYNPALGGPIVMTPTHDVVAPPTGRMMHTSVKPDQLYEPTDQDMLGFYALGDPLEQVAAEARRRGKIGAKVNMGGTDLYYITSPEAAGIMPMTRTDDNATVGRSLSPRELVAQTGYDEERMTEILGPSLYGDFSQQQAVTVKETLQNAADSMKNLLDSGQLKNGRIAITSDSAARTMTIHDNGVGMVPEILATKFLEVGGTHKESATDPSGSFGIAKLQFLYGSGRLHVTTMRNGEVSVLETTGKQIKKSLKDKSQLPRIQVRDPTAKDLEMFPDGHGTRIELTIPDSYIEKGVTKPIPMYEFAHKHILTSLFHSPLFNKIDVTYNGETMPIGNAFPADKYTQLANLVQFDWGTARVYVSKGPNNPEWEGEPNLHVLSNGLHQFDIKVPLDPLKPYGKTVAKDFYIDIKPAGKPEEGNYPFEVSRQGFSPRSEADFGQIILFLSNTYMELEVEQQVTNYGDIEYLSLGPNGLERTGKMSVAPKAIQKGDVGLAGTTLKEAKNETIKVENGHLVVGGRDIPALTPENVSKFKVDFKKLTIPQNEINPDSIMVHNNVVLDTGAMIDAATGEQIPSVTEQDFVTWAREKHGARFDEFIGTVGAVFLNMRNLISHVMGYPEMMKEAVGISFDPGYNGVNIVVPFRGMFINPAVSKYGMDFKRVAIDYMATMVHESAHHKVRGHDEHFAAEQEAIWTELNAQVGMEMFTIYSRIESMLERYADVYGSLNSVFNKTSIYTVKTRGRRFSSGTRQTSDGSNVADMVRSGQAAASTRVLLAAAYDRQGGTSQEPGREDVRPTATSTGNVDHDHLQENWRAMHSAVTPAPRQPATQTAILAAQRAMGGGTLPAPVRNMVAFADRINWLYKWTAGLDQLVTANMRFFPLLAYHEKVVGMHREESFIHDAALRISKDWRSVNKDAFVGFIDDIANMRYLTQQERAQGVVRKPTAAEEARHAAQHGAGVEEIALYNRMNKLFDTFYVLVEDNAIQRADRIWGPNGKTPDALKHIDEVLKIRGAGAQFRARPQFPFMRFGNLYSVMKDSNGKVKHFETYERRGLKSAAQVQKEGHARLDSLKAPGDTVVSDVLPEAAEPFIGMPVVLLRSMTGLNLSPEQLNLLEQIQYEAAPTPNYRLRNPVGQKKYIPGYSMDFQRSFARYFFHGARYYARTKYADGLNQDISAARAVGGVKANAIANYMQDHLTNTVMDAKGDFGFFRGAIFMWAMGYVPAAATQNLTQTPMITLPYLAAKFGDFRASKALINAMTKSSTFYKRKHYETTTEQELQAMSYGIKTGRITEAQASDLAALAQGGNLVQGIGGNTAQRAWTAFMEKGAFMFEQAEQFNRRVAYRATYNLAKADPNAKIVQEAVARYREEYERLKVGVVYGTQTIGGSEEEARAIVTAAHATEQTQFVYARWARPRIFRGKASVVLVFKRYVQSLMYLMGQGGAGFLVRYMILAALIGGVYAIPGFDDLDGLLKAALRWAGYNADPQRFMREYIMQFTNGAVPPDMVLQGLARRGFGLPALLDMMGSLPGSIGRGFSTRPATTVPYPVLDRSKAVGPGTVLPVDFGKLLDPYQKDAPSTLAEQTQKASGAVFSVGFNMYKALMDRDRPVGDFKRWEPAMPRALSSVSRSFRAFNEGRERGRGGPAGAPSVMTFDTRDTEQMMEAMAMAGGYTPLSVSQKFDRDTMKADYIRYYDITREGLLHQFYEASKGGSDRELDAVRDAVRRYNESLPDEVRGKAITRDNIVQSIKARERGRIAKEEGISVKKKEIPAMRYIDTLFPEAIDVHRAR